MGEVDRRRVDRHRRVDEHRQLGDAPRLLEVVEVEEDLLGAPDGEGGDHQHAPALHRVLHRALERGGGLLLASDESPIRTVVTRSYAEFADDITRQCATAKLPQAGEWESDADGSCMLELDGTAAVRCSVRCREGRRLRKFRNSAPPKASGRIIFR